MNLALDYTNSEVRNAEITVSGSKSESNRLLILEQWFPNLLLKNLSDSDDTRHLQKALSSTDAIIDIGHAGTAMRFLTAYFAVAEGREHILTGSERMQNRPIRILVDALRMLGATIDYVEKEGYPPLRIKGKNILKDKVRIQGNVSSQYISALLLIAPKLKNGLEIELLETVTSRPYLEMTLDLLAQLGIDTSFKGNSIKVFPKNEIDDKVITIESDWSSASYYYSLVALSKAGTSITLSAFKKDSLQGDSVLAKIYRDFGVETIFGNNTIVLTKTEGHKKSIDLDLSNAPDIAQTIAVTCFGLGMECHLRGLHTLKIKETDRLVALQNELQKFGASVRITDDSIVLKPKQSGPDEQVIVQTYNDHRMAMAFAPLSLKIPLTIADSEVVTKSYVTFWEDFNKCFRV
ncbi:MAG: 3-phosphoshikimate 1-carboxyvinyltransferase [Flavobacteriaceae bacterium]|nr:3-phosphoshikimate 1-carboxyvinyltransferase [Flavobacteriaceae bacterium]